MNKNASLIPYFLKRIFIITFILGVIAYGFIFNHGFTFTDELCALLFLIVYMCYTFTYNLLGKEMIITHSILFLFFIYAYFWGQNTPKAALVDLIIISKPFLIFYICYYLPINFNRTFRKKLQVFCISISIISLFIGFNSTIIRYFFSAEAQMASTISIAAILYLYCSKKTSKDIIISTLILSVGLLSARSKFYGFYISYIFIFLLADKINFKKKLSFTKILSIILLIGAIIVITWEKIYLYVYSGGLNNENASDMIARPALYMGMIEILKQNPILGSGMGSYANYASAAYYSPIYYKLGYEKIWGLTPDMPAFAADTFFPTLAQYGIIGILLFLFFWKKRIKEAQIYFAKLPQFNIHYKLCIAIVIFFFIESLADSTFTQNRGMFMMGILGVILNEGKHYYFQHNIKQKDISNSITDKQSSN